MNERRRILHDDGGGADVVTLRVTTTDGSTNVGIEMVVTNGNNVYPVTTDSQGKVSLTGLSGGCTIDCETHEISVYEFIATGTMTVDISAYVNSFPMGETRSFGYTGAASEVQLIPGSYKLQVWGAQGGTYSSYTGGRGGYSEGVLTLLQALKVYVFVGGQGSRSGNGGWNGGGGGSGSASYSSSGTSGSSYMACGGGGTDIALVTSSMAYSSYRTNRSSESLLSRIIVAGGGSGGAYTTRSETTSSTTWESFASGSDNYGDFVWNNIHCRKVSIPATGGKTYRGKITRKNEYSNYYYVYFQYGINNNGTWTLKQTVNATNNTFVTINLPSDCNEIRACHNGIQGLDEPADTFTYTIQVQTTTSSTSTTSDYAYGYVGGGTEGGCYSSTYAGKQNAAGTNGAFGLGANQTTTNYRHCAACGGGGWYGGGGGLYSDSSKTYVKYSGGGSGFVNIAANASYRPSGYTGIELDSGTTYAGNTYFPNTANTGTEYGHSGNGYAKITRFAVCAITLIVKDEDNLPVEGANLTVSNSENTYTGTTDTNGEATVTVVNGSYAVTCSEYSLSPSQITVTRNATFRFLATEKLDFSYTGAVQTKTLKAGVYKFEVWGAQGGNATYNGYTGTGGKGGYSVGTLVVDTDTQLYIMVGGQGTFNSGSSAATTGGFNGGGTGYNYSTSYTAAGGGGASDIRIGQNSLYARVIVAGGGGGSGVYSSTAGTGGYGGGTSGGTGSVVYSGYGVGTGGTQTSAGTCNGSGSYNGSASFGIGASKTSGSGGYNGAGGGGGWYGGGCGGAVSNCGGGGSGYVYNASTASNYPSGCLLNSSYYLSDAQTIAGNASMPSTSGGTETGHSGNGFVRITKM